MKTIIERLVLIIIGLGTMLMMFSFLGFYCYWIQIFFNKAVMFFLDGSVLEFLCAVLILGFSITFAGLLIVLIFMKGLED